MYQLLISVQLSPELINLGLFSMKKFLKQCYICEWSMIFDGKDRAVFDVCNELTLYDCTIIARLHTIIDILLKFKN
jgi:hypothetical protein